MSPDHSREQRLGSKPKGERYGVRKALARWPEVPGYVPGG